MALHAPTPLQELVGQHLEIPDEPLLLAIYYKPEREPRDIFLFEVIENFGAGDIDPDRELYEVIVLPASSFPLEPGQRLHMVFTHPREFETAVRENWNHAAELVRAIQSGDYMILHSDPNHPHLRHLINA